MINLDQSNQISGHNHEPQSTQIPPPQQHPAEVAAAQHLRLQNMGSFSDLRSSEAPQEAAFISSTGGYAQITGSNTA